MTYSTIGISDNINIKSEPVLCEKSFFVSSTNDGLLNNLKELTYEGKCFLICCLDLILRDNGIDAVPWILKHVEIPDSSTTIFKIIECWIANPTIEEIGQNINNFGKTESFKKSVKVLDEDFHYGILGCEKTKNGIQKQSIH